MTEFVDFTLAEAVEIARRAVADMDKLGADGLPVRSVSRVLLGHIESLGRHIQYIELEHDAACKILDGTIDHLTAENQRLRQALDGSYL